jgi:hypothetical protein
VEGEAVGMARHGGRTGGRNGGAFFASQTDAAKH